MATSPLSSRGPTRGRNCYVTPAFSGLPNAKKGEKIRRGYLTPAFWGFPNPKRAYKIRNGYLASAFFGAKKSAELLHKMIILAGSNP